MFLFWTCSINYCVYEFCLTVEKNYEISYSWFKNCIFATFFIDNVRAILNKKNSFPIKDSPQEKVEHKDFMKKNRSITLDLRHRIWRTVLMWTNSTYSIFIDLLLLIHMLCISFKYCIGLKWKINRKVACFNGSNILKYKVAHAMNISYLIWNLFSLMAQAIITLQQQRTNVQRTNTIEPN